MYLKIEVGKIYQGGTTLHANSKKRVLLIDRRDSGKRFVRWMNVKKDGSFGAVGWTELGKFQSWARSMVD